ncbi:MAG TPA: hypothetical protein VHE14_04805 [Solirubrobacteraceae bacterium]|nr:hypothetical protein [Solirubrobacteraceae bacterium]
MPASIGRAVLALTLAGSLIAAQAAAAAPAAKPAPSNGAGLARVVLAFIPPPRYANAAPTNPSLLQLFGTRFALSGLGILGATQGNYNEQQALLDITQGSRVSQTTYSPSDPPPLPIIGPTGKAHVVTWPRVKARAAGAPGKFVPGLLAGSIPGGAGYVDVGHRVHQDAVVAADRDGAIAATSVGSRRNLLGRIQSMVRRKGFVVLDLPRAPFGLQVLDRMLARRPANELVIVVKQPPATEYKKRLPPQLLPIATAGLSRRPGALTSDTTHREGLVAGIDILPTVLAHLGIRRPSDAQGRPIRVTGRRDAGGLQSLYNRWRVMTARRFTLILAFVLIWLGLVPLYGLIGDRRGVRAAMRLGGLALLWTPTTALIGGAMRPSKTIEIVVVAGGAFVLAALNDRLVRWPRGPWLPALVGLAVYTVAVVRGSTLLVESVYSSNPIFGSRFYGIGNELVAALVTLLLVGLAAALPARRPTARDAWAFVFAGLVFGAVLGPGLLGAKVGGVITLGGGIAVATLLMLPRGPSKKAIALAIATPALAILALAAIDLLTAGNGHLERNVLHGTSVGDVLKQLGRRYELAFNILHHGVIPLDTAACLLGIAFAIKYRDRVLAPVRESAAWRAALAGAAGAGIVGSLGNDSGVILLIVCSYGAAWVIIYLRGDPRLAVAPASVAAEASPARPLSAPGGEAAP